MWWFTPRDKRTMIKRVLRRQALAERVLRDATIPRLTANNKDIARTAVRLAREDEALFERVFGEPMPLQLRAALQVEEELWTTLTRTETYSEQNRRQVQEHAKKAHQVLTLERDMLNSPLTQRFLRALARIKGIGP